MVARMDAIEPLRPMIEAAVFAFIDREQFAPSDFIRARDESLSLAPGLLSAVLEHCSPKPQTLAQRVRWLAGLIEGAPRERGRGIDMRRRAAVSMQ